MEGVNFWSYNVNYEGSTALGGKSRPLGLFLRKHPPADKSYIEYNQEDPNPGESRRKAIRTNRELLVLAMQPGPEKTSPRQIEQLDYLSLFFKAFVHVPSDDNAVADVLSWVSSTDMVSRMNAPSIYKDNDVKVAHPM